MKNLFHFAVCKGQLGTLCSACKVLLHYLLKNLKKQSEMEITVPNMLPTKEILLPIKALCSGTSVLARSDQVALIAIMKNAKLPPHIKTSMSSINASK